jgi:GNAT superfamily N-acetyltransferase
VTKLKGFANSEQEPDPDRIRAEMSLRRVEMADVGRFWLARIEGEPAATFAWYEDTDRFIFNLATRVLFRRRGIARWLLCDFLAQSYAHECRSIIINADTADTPIQLYRRLGFTDEVYWRGRFELRRHASAVREG